MYATNWEAFKARIQQHEGCEVFCAFEMARDIGEDHPRDFVNRAALEGLIKRVSGATPNECMYRIGNGVPVLPEP